MVRLKLNPPKPIEGSHIHRFVRGITTATTKIKRQAALKTSTKPSKSQPSSAIPTQDQGTPELSASENGVSKKRKLDENLPGTPRKKAKRQEQEAFPENSILNVSRQEDASQAGVSSPGFGRRYSPDRGRQRRTRGRSLTAKIATAAVPIFLALEAQKQSHEAQDVISEKATPTLKDTLTKKGAKRPTRSREQQKPVLPDLEKEHRDVEKLYHETKIVMDGQTLVTKNQESSTRQGTKRVANDDGVETSLSSEPQAKKQRLRLICHPRKAGKIESPRPETPKTQYVDDAKGEEPLVENIQVSRSKPKSKRKNILFKERRQK